MTTEVVVLGGGYVGVWAARSVVGRRGVRVTLVSMAPHHSFHGWTAEVITGHVAPERARVPLVELVPGARHLHGVVGTVDRVARTVDVMSATGAQRLRYDHLVVATGSRDATDRVPGLTEHGWSLKHDRALLEMNGNLAGVVEMAARTTDPARRRRLLHVVVAGAGFAGTEAACAIAQRLRAAVAAEPALAGERATVTLLGAGADVLPSLRPRFEAVAEYAAGKLVEAGVTVRSNARLASVTPTGAVLEGGTVLAAATVISALGQTPVAPAGLEDLATDTAGRLVTDRFLRVAANVWAGGDCAAVPHPAGSGPCPANALWAIYHGKRIGANIVRALRGREPAPFRFPGLGQGASYGIGRGAAELYGVALTGWVAWLARWVFFHAYMPSRKVALATLVEWRRHPALPQAGAQPWEDRGRAARPHDRRSTAPR